MYFETGASEHTSETRVETCSFNALPGRAGPCAAPLGSWEPAQSCCCAQEVMRTILNNVPAPADRPMSTTTPPTIEPLITTLGGRITCRRCTAKSKRTGNQCRAIAMKGSKTSKCRAHGGRSTGPKTAEGRARIAAAHLVHGEETRAGREAAKAARRRLRELEELARRAGLLKRRPGR